MEVAVLLTGYDACLISTTIQKPTVQGKQSDYFSRRGKYLMRATEADVYTLIIKLQEHFAKIAKHRQIIKSETAAIEKELEAFHAALRVKTIPGVI